ncbi:hypothetical protein ACFRAR_11370 [Kitasatospora sp. NPDC056651]|uniref:hypothetical protein n=1 Tax=Kitasatospora sp. NPDC056651 TaxID=3345892 RepID=UPI0036B6DD83
MTRRQVPADPTARAATTSTLRFSGRAQKNIDTLILLMATLDLSEAEVRRQTGESRSHLLWRWKFQRTRGFGIDATQARRALDELRELADGLPAETKADITAVERGMLRACEWCEQLKIPPATRHGGWPQKFCSPACQQKNCRKRAAQNQASADGPS